MFPSDYEDKTPKDVREFLNDMGWWCGRMISGSKSGYRRWRPKNIPIFNSNMCTLTHGKIWHGDLDITDDDETLKKIAAYLNEPIYLLYEMDGRFENGEKPRIDKAIFAVVDGKMVVSNKDYEEYYHVCKSGSLKGRWVYKPKYRREDEYKKKRKKRKTKKLQPKK